jgi:hypothetical protein
VIFQKLNNFFGVLKDQKKKPGKKGVEPMPFGFGNHCSTN